MELTVATLSIYVKRAQIFSTEYRNQMHQRNLTFGIRYLGLSDAVAAFAANIWCTLLQFAPVYVNSGLWAKKRNILKRTFSIMWNRETEREGDNAATIALCTPTKSCNERANRNTNTHAHKQKA